ncbi:hypothetical protein B566_EDAN002475 [Ephemera danica]|nr:hypothetical protein B566_EDAN002475 [Ephemera danica]
MDAKQLLQALHQLNKNHNCLFHIGVYAADTIPTKYKRPAAIIANTDEQHKPGLRPFLVREMTDRAISL